ncbi:hypothetical protein CAPTEDRAFT_20039 [Capitella teleta]|uniref:Cyanocobalamin reductase (cyanide-eliminating) n=1 Tax=Capitella teleta TaxID=283909 RepID=N1PB48_CAPTE|nr:hypothetical protein CAPTEDRAFT_20039 [Capitella teleta]|eukprot:ELU18887.1 hypothetical protein CAPTEDRAFT_20039 [Capitella teleta]
MSVEDIKLVLKGIFEPAGFEVYPFKIGWYNKNVLKIFKFDLPEDTIAFIIISTPCMFEKALIPFVCREQCTGAKDPIDECVGHYFSEAKEAFPSHDILAIQDFEMHPGTRRAKVLVQTAGHVAGAAYYYQRADIKEDPWKEKQRIYGVSMHPEFGGWFALRGVLIFKDLQDPDLPFIPSKDVLDTDEKKINVLEKFNGNWKDWTYRDVVEPKERYSEMQKNYFATQPNQRKEIIEAMRKSLDHNDQCDH